MTRLLADENFPFPVVHALRGIGFDVLTLGDLRLAGQSLTDSAVLKLASDDSRAVLTLNRTHFIRLHGAVPNHAGIIVCSSTWILMRRRSAFTRLLERSRPSLAGLFASIA